MTAPVAVVRNLLDRVLPPSARDRVRRAGFGIRQARLIPPAELRYRVHGSTDDIDQYVQTGLRCSAELASVAVRYGATEQSRVLDFGAGCGRTLLRLRELWPAARMTATDMDGRGIAWLSQADSKVRTSVNGRFPPLAFLDDSFDVVYAVSVFTHIDEPDQDAWLAELSRVTRPGGLALVTVHSRDALPPLPTDVLARLESHGFAYVTTDKWKGQFPKWYQTSVHDPSYVLKHFAQWFDVLELIPRGINDHQDLVVLRTRN